jgi:hypothetical protein
MQRFDEPIQLVSGNAPSLRAVCAAQPAVAPPCEGANGGNDGILTTASPPLHVRPDGSGPAGIPDHRLKARTSVVVLDGTRRTWSTRRHHLPSVAEASRDVGRAPNEEEMAVASDLAKGLGKAYEDKSLTEILDAPPAALAGVTVAEELATAFNKVPAF